MAKQIKNFSQEIQKSNEIENSISFSNGTYVNIDPKVDLIFLDTINGDIILDGFSSGEKGQKITFVKNSPNNSVVVKNLSSTSSKKILNSATVDINIFKNKVGIFFLFCDGVQWYCDEDCNTFKMTTNLTTNQVVFTAKNCLSANFDFSIKDSTGHKRFLVSAIKLSLNSTTGTTKEITNFVTGTLNNKTTYNISYTNTDIILRVTTTGVISEVWGKCDMLK